MEPHASRPYMPGYGIEPAGDDGAGLLPWSWAVERLVASKRYWLATVRTGAGARPHLMPVWAVWLDDQLWFSSSPGSRKTRNAMANAAVSISTDDPMRPVVVEGQAARVYAAAAIARFNDAVNAKYETDYDVAFYLDNAVFAVTPHVVIALDEDDFTNSPTKWVLRDG